MTIFKYFKCSNSKSRVTEHWRKVFNVFYRHSFPCKRHSRRLCRRRVYTEFPACNKYVQLTMGYFSKARMNSKSFQITYCRSAVYIICKYSVCLTTCCIVTSCASITNVHYTGRKGFNYDLEQYRPYHVRSCSHA